MKIFIAIIVKRKMKTEIKATLKNRAVVCSSSTADNVTKISSPFSKAINDWAVDPKVVN